MKPMLAREYTLPVGNECIIPTYEEALRFFTLQGWKGEIWFGLAETETHDIMGWGIRSGNRYRVVSAFRDVLTKLPYWRSTNLKEAAVLFIATELTF